MLKKQEIGIVIKQDILEKQVKSSYLGIGSNLGNKLANIQKTKKLLLLNAIHIEDCSYYYETPSWPNRKFLTNRPTQYNIELLAKS